MDITAKREENSYFLARSLADIRHDLAVVFAAACVMLILLYACGTSRKPSPATALNSRDMDSPSRMILGQFIAIFSSE